MTPELLLKFMAAYPCQELLNVDGEPSGIFQLPPARLVFVYLDKPRESDNGKPKYSTAFLFPLDANVDPLKNAVATLAQSEFGPTWKSSGLKIGLKPQDKLVEKYPQFQAGGVYLEASTTRPAPIVDRGAIPVEGSDTNVVYPGAWAIGRVALFSYRTTMNKGISFGLRGVQIIADDERFAATGSKVDDFGIVPIGDTGKSNGAAASMPGKAADLW